MKYIIYLSIYLYVSTSHIMVFACDGITWWNIIYYIVYKHWYTVVICGPDGKSMKKLQKKNVGQPFSHRCRISL